ncbi:MAG: hypothetical protein HY078_08945 [Elusimicrobia bacterium]|nr:hypothetical protein [Elusimicrobiota bacterium]
MKGLIVMAAMAALWTEPAGATPFPREIPATPERTGVIRDAWDDPGVQAAIAAVKRNGLLKNVEETSVALSEACGTFGCNRTYLVVFTFGTNHHVNYHQSSVLAKVSQSPRTGKSVEVVSSCAE